MPGINVGVDLGTAYVTAYVQGQGIVMREANAVCYDAATGEVLAVGSTAGDMLSRTPEALELKSPMQNGVVSDFSAMKEVLSFVLNKVSGNRVFRPNLILSVPSGIPALDQRTMADVACACGAGKVSLLPSPVAAALGAGEEISKPRGTLVLDIGAGTADVAALTMGTVAKTVSSRFAGDEADEMICRYLRKERGVLVGLPTARRIKHAVGCAAKREEEVEIAANGKDALSLLPLEFAVSSSEICDALQGWVDALASSVQEVLDELPAEMYTDICEGGMFLAGGMSHLWGLDQALSERLHLAVHTVPDGELCAAKGAGIALKNIKTLEDHGFLFRLRDHSPDPTL